MGSNPISPTMKQFYRNDWYSWVSREIFKVDKIEYEDAANEPRFFCEYVLNHRENIGVTLIKVHNLPIHQLPANWSAA